MPFFEHWSILSLCCCLGSDWDRHRRILILAILHLLHLQFLHNPPKLDTSFTVFVDHLQYEHGQLCHVCRKWHFRMVSLRWQVERTCLSFRSDSTSTVERHLDFENNWSMFSWVFIRSTGVEEISLAIIIKSPLNRTRTDLGCRSSTVLPCKTETKLEDNGRDPLTFGVNLSLVDFVRCCIPCSKQDLFDVANVYMYVCQEEQKSTQTVGASGRD